MNQLYTLFKTANSKNRKWNLLKTFLQTTVFWIVFLFIFPNLINWLEVLWEVPSFSKLPLFGWICFACFGCLGLYSGYTMSWWGRGTPLPMDCPNQLVIRGPYKIVRNPMAVAGIGQGLSVGLVLGSYGTIIYALLGALLWHVFVRPPEELDLTERFGVDYQAYQQSVKCWIPTF